jgi:hypothetical protein
MYISLLAGFKLTTLVRIGTDCIGSCKCNYHIITTMTCLILKYTNITLTLLLDRIKPVCRPLSSFLLYLFHRFIDTISKEEYDRKFYRVNSGMVLVLNNIEFNVPGIDLGDRKGSDLDASVICQRFSDIEIDIRGSLRVDGKPALSCLITGLELWCLMQF